MFSGLFDQYRGLRKEIYVLLIGKIVTAMGSMAWAMMTIILSTKLDFTASQITLWMSVFSVIVMPVSLIGGKLADTCNKKAVILLSDLVEVIGYFYCASVPLSITSIIVFFVCSAIETLSGASYETLIADLSCSEDRERANSLLYFGTNLGMVLAPTLGGLLVKEHVNLIFLISASATLFAIVIEFIYLKDISVTVDNSNKYEKARDGVPLSQILKENKVIAVFLVIYGFEWLVYGQYNFLMPLDLTAVHGEDGSLIFGILSSVNCLTVILFTTIVTRIFRKTQDIVKFTWGMVLFGIGYIIFILYTKNPWMCYFAIFVFTIGEIFETLSSSVIITRRVPMTHRGRILSFQGVLGNVIYIIFQQIVSRIYDNKGSIYSWTFIMVITVLLTVALIILQKYDRINFPDLYRNNDNSTAEEQ